MHLLITSAFDFNSQAPVVARHRALLKGWVEAGLGPATLVLSTTEPGHEPILPGGVQVFAVGRPSPGGWRVAALRGLRALLNRMVKEGQPPDAALVVDRDPILLPGSIRLLHRQGVPVLHEITEFPDVVARPGLRGLVEDEVFRRLVLRRLDGVMCISPQLCSWVRAHASVPVEHIGGLVDLDLFAPPQQTVRPSSVLIGYCGSLDERKDGVRGLLRSIALVDHDVRLRVLAGPHSDAQRNDLHAAIQSLGLDDRVEVIGPVPPGEVPGLLGSCDVLALPRPVSRQAEGGFPTKLGEYLATGRPVVVSAVGSIPRELTSGVDATIVPPGDVTAWAAALTDLARDPHGRDVIGRGGRQRAELDWSPQHAARRVAELMRVVGSHG